MGGQHAQHCRPKGLLQEGARISCRTASAFRHECAGSPPDVFSCLFLSGSSGVRASRRMLPQPTQ